MIIFLLFLHFSTKFESMIFAICLVDENSNKASARKFIEEIERTGIRDGESDKAKMTDVFLIKFDNC